MTKSKEIVEQERLMEKYSHDPSFVRQCLLKIKTIQLEEAKKEIDKTVKISELALATYGL
jgi:hypothetical protein